MVAMHDLAGLPPELGAGLPAQIYRLVQAGFARQPFFQPLPLETFQQWLAQRQGVLDPRLTLLAFVDGQLRGLLLGQRHGADLVVRTLVVLPGRPQAGLGRRLLHDAHCRASDLGCTGVIHALMHQQGTSLALSRRWTGTGHGSVIMVRRLNSGFL